MATKAKPQSQTMRTAAMTTGAQTPVRYCAIPAIAERPMPADIDPMRRDAILEDEKRWANGTELRYHFLGRKTDGENVRFTNGTVKWGTYVGKSADRLVVRNAFAEWAKQGIGIKFREVKTREDAEIRIGFLQGGGSWSYVGRDNVNLDQAKNPNARTMNFGWPLTNGQDGRDTALHEIGHALGMPHEHQNPNAGIVWDEPKVIEYFAQPPNSWPPDRTHWNILRKLPVHEVVGSNWDPDSIMHYRFAPGLIISPESYKTTGIRPKPGLSENDIAWVQRFYPQLSLETYREAAVNRSELLQIEPRGQANFIFVPKETRDYTLQLFGEADCTLVLFEKESDHSIRFRAGEDDAGTPERARIRMRLQRGREYVVRVLMHYSPKPEDAAFMVS